jgi:hypothetical protein
MVADVAVGPRQVATPFVSTLVLIESDVDQVTAASGWLESGTFTAQTRP